MNKDVVIFDLDGTLADIQHRRHFVENGRKDWGLFFKACVNDDLIEPTAEILDLLAFRGKEIWIVSGRSDEVAIETKNWLDAHDIVYHRCIMRKKGDHRPDDNLKQQWIDDKVIPIERVLCVFDDRKRVVDMWRRNGLICYQVAEGDF